MLQSRSIAVNELLQWRCEEKACDCVGDLQKTDALRESWLDGVMKLRATTCSFKEQKVRSHIKTTLSSLLRLPPKRFQYVTGGRVVCKAVFVWAHGFSDSTFHRVRSELNKELQDALPKEVLFVCGCLVTCV